MFEDLFKKITNEIPDKTIYVYGMGTTGRLFVDLCLKHQFAVEAIMVGKGHKEVEKYKGIPVIELEGIFEGTILYSVKNDDLRKELSQSYKLVDMSSVRVYRDLLNAWYEEFYSDNKNTISFDGDLIITQNLRIVNPKIVSKEDWDCFLQEAGDIILPELFDDYDRIDEGAYRHGQVGIEKGDVVIDAGANLGVFSAVAACKGAGICYAFEPMDRNFKYLIRQANEYDSIIPMKYALDDKSRKTKITCNGSESSIYMTMEGCPTEEIECITLDEFAENNKLSSIDFIKADIEGAECNMLRGSTHVLKEYSPKLAICTYHRPTDKDELTDIILSANPNYKIEYSWKKLFAHV